MAERSLFARLRLERLTVFILSCLATVAMFFWTGTERLDNQIYDLFMPIDARSVREDIVIVAIDDDALELVGPWPWPRHKLADLITIIVRSRPKALGVNVLLTGRRRKRDDQTLASAIAAARIPVYLTVGISNAGSHSTARALFPPTAIGKAATGLGQTSFPLDSDGLVRRAFLELPAQGRIWPSLARLLAGSPPAEHRAYGGEPTLIPFSSNHFTTISARQLMAAPDTVTSIANRRVLLGVTATGVESKLPTPLSGNNGNLSGTEIEAHLLAALLDHELRKPLSRTPSVLASLLLLSLAFVTSSRVKPSHAVIFTIAITCLILIADLLVLTLFNLWFAPAAMICGLTLSQSLWVWRRTSAIMAFMVGEIGHYQDSGSMPTLRHTLSDPLIGQAETLAATLKSARMSHQFTVDTLDQLPTAVLVLGLDGKVKLANAVARRLFATHWEKIPLDCDLADLCEGFILGDSPAQWHFGSSPETNEERLVIVRVPGGPYFELSLGLIRSRDEVPHAWIVQLTDITLVRAATQQREQVMSLLTHDLRSPLAAIVAAVAQCTPAHAENSLRMASRFALRALKMTEDYVLFAKASESKFYCELLSCRLLLEDALEEVLTHIPSADVRVRLGGDAVPWLISGDSILLHRCLVNLIGNAIKHGRLGGRIYCSIQNVVVSGGRMVEIAIHDWGPGIAPEAVPTIFEPFCKGVGLASRQGTGLGLALVERVARGHGGSIGYDRIADRCTRFCLRLPAADEVEAPFDDFDPPDDH